MPSLKGLRAIAQVLLDTREFGSPSAL